MVATPRRVQIRPVPPAAKQAGTPAAPLARGSRVAGTPPVRRSRPLAPASPPGSNGVSRNGSATQRKNGTTNGALRRPATNGRSAIVDVSAVGAGVATRDFVTPGLPGSDLPERLVEVVATPGWHTEEGGGPVLGEPPASFDPRYAGPLPDTLWKLFGDEGTPVDVDGTSTLALNKPGVVWQVRSGHVNLFAVRKRPGQSFGSRYHVLSAEPGDLLVGVDLAPDGQDGTLELIATGQPGTHVVELEQGRLAYATSEFRLAEAVAYLVDRWIVALESVTRKTLVPGRIIELVSGDEVALPQGACGRPGQGVAWASVPNWSVIVHGAASSQVLPSIPEQAFLPLSDDCWLQVKEPMLVTTVGTLAYFGSDPTWASLQQFHRLILTETAHKIDEEREADRELMLRRAETDRKNLDVVLSDLSHLDIVAAGTSLKKHVETDSLLAACKIVGKELGVTVQEPAYKVDPRLMTPLQAIARASRLRIRPVTLAGHWWNADAGPLIGTVAATGQSVALLPADTGTYDVVDPISLERKPVTEAAAAILSPRANSLYRSFPDKAMTLREVLAFGFRGGRKDLYTIFGAGILGGVVAMLTPLATGMMFNTVIPAADDAQLVTLICALMAGAIGAAAFDLTRAISLLRLEGRVDSSIQAASWDRLLSLPVPFFHKYTTGDLAGRSMAVSAIRQTLTGAGINTVLSLVFSGSSFFLLFAYSPQLAFVVTGLLGVLIFVTTYANKTLAKYQAQVTGSEGKSSGSVTQLLGGVGKLRVAGVEHRAFGFWAKVFRVQNTAASMIKLQQLYLQAFQGAFPIISSVIVYYVMGTQPTRMATGTFLAFNAAMGQFLGAALGLSMAMSTILAVVPQYKRAKPILETAPEVDSGKSDAGELTGAVEIKNVTFKYSADGPEILHDISIFAAPGEFVAIVGPSGAGKSTILRLLLGFERPSEGMVTYDEKDLSQLDVRTVRQQLGVVLQHGKLLPGDIFRNIIGTAPLTLDDAWEAARTAGIAEDIERMPMGMFTYLPEGAGTLSGGQKQRVLIARAIVHQPKILLFDEATSALDNQSQAQISRSLERLKATRIVIAHRLSTIMNADRIYVVVGGSIVQTGTYEELMRQEGPFVELARRQMV